MAIAFCHSCLTSFNASSCPKCGRVDVMYDEDLQVEPDTIEAAHAEALRRQLERDKEESRRTAHFEAVGKAIERRPIEPHELSSIIGHLKECFFYTRESAGTEKLREVLKSAMLEAESLETITFKRWKERKAV